MKMLEIDENSFRSFYIEMLFDEKVISSGTAFFAEAQGRVLLFTNRHNVTGRNNDTGEYLSKTGGIPNKIKAYFPIPQTLNNEEKSFGTSRWMYVIGNLYFDEYFEHPVWVEHPLRERVDVVELVIDPGFNVKELTYNVDNCWYKSKVGELINVIGFPYGTAVDRFPIWVTGHIASETDSNYEKLPIFLIDSRTRSGQSGSPVIGRFKIGQTITYKGKKYQSKGEGYYFLGIYSGRINIESDLGKVWKVEVIREILLNGIQTGRPQVNN